MDKLTGRLLFVDDEVNITKTLFRQFMPLDYDVFTANSGAEALELLDSEPVDVVISDMRMPEMNGAQFLKEVNEKWPDVGRILLTGYSEVDAAMDAINDGKIHYYLTKPWTEEHIETAIQSCLDHKRLRDQNQLLLTELDEKNQTLENLLSELDDKNKSLSSMNDSLEEKVKARTLELQAAFSELQQSHSATIQICASLTENMQSAHVGHTAKVARVAVCLAEAMKLPELTCQHLEYAALLYSLGKIGFAPELLQTPYTKLSVKQLKTFQQYPLIGATTLSAMNALDEVSDIVIAHRERMDGMGYPNHLAGDDICLPARILSVAVDFELLQIGLLTTDTLTPAQAVAYLCSHAGDVYDEAITTQLKPVLERLGSSEANLKERLISANALMPGMKLSRDLISDGGMFLLPKDHVLDDKTINNLCKIEGLNVYVM